MGEKSRYESLPIPTYDEATSSRPQSSHSFLGPSEVSHDAERQGLLGQNSSARLHGYQPPTVESARSSMDFSVSSGGNSARNSTDGLRQEIAQMEIEDPESRGTTWKRISTLTSNIHLPFRRWLPSLHSVRMRLPSWPDTYRPGWILIIRGFALLLVLSIAYVLFFTGLLRWRHRGTVPYLEEDVRLHVQGRINETRIEENLRHLTKWDHMAGTQGNFFLAQWIALQMENSGLDSASLEKFEVYLNYPTKDGRRLAIVSPPEKAWEAKLEEEKAYKDREQTYVFHGLSKSGNVTGPLVYANYGAKEDFERLKDQGIKINGSIALVRYGGGQGDRALKVKDAELAGAIGCIIYSDPKEDGFTRGKPYPEGRWRPEDSVQRGTVALTSFIAGDVLTPGRPSLPGSNDRIKKEDSAGLNKIPSIPIAWRDAQPLLQALKGHGKKLEDDYWRGGVPDVEWWTGDDHSPLVNLQNEQDEVEKQPIYNVIGRIEGTEQKEKSIIIGNHYDSWCFGGVDPGSGTAVLVELIHVFGELMKFGWRPRRSIEFIAWDAEEYNLIGSTEHVEAHLDNLRRNGYAYINVDVAVSGPNFAAAASPVLSKALMRVLKRTADPYTGKVLNDIWREKGSKLDSLGAGSDYLAFQDFAGVSSIDLSFMGDPFPYHSCYENFDWMSKHGDPGFLYHKTMGQITSLLILELADEELLPFDLEAYAVAVDGYVKGLETFVANKTQVDTTAKGDSLDFSNLHNATKTLAANAKRFHDWDAAWFRAYSDATAMQESDLAIVQRMVHNNKMADFETNLLDVDGGLPTRPQYKHVLFAPDKWSGYDGAYFPGPRDALELGDWDLAQQQLDLAANIIRGASERLLE